MQEEYAVIRKPIQLMCHVFGTEELEGTMAKGNCSIWLQDEKNIG